MGESVVSIGRIGAGVLVSAIIFGCSGDVQSFRLGARVELKNVAIPEIGPAVLWVVKAVDCFSCSSPVYTLRQLQERSPISVPLIVLIVDGDSVTVRSVLRRERLSARLYLADRGDRVLARTHGLSIPSLMAIHDGRITQLWSDPLLRRLAVVTLAANLRIAQFTE